MSGSGQVIPQKTADFPASVTFMPGMRSGQPTIGGTRMPLHTILFALWDGGVEHATQGWNVSREQCLVAAWFAGMYCIDDLPTMKGRTRGRKWIRRYGEWARAHDGEMWRGNFDKVPDPPDSMAA